jgi:hypothetical protein
MTGKFYANRKIKPSSYSSNISRSKSLEHTPIIPYWALITESMICVTKVEWYCAYISTFFNHPAFSKRHGKFPMPMVLICAQIIILSASPAANAAFDYRPTALLLGNQTLVKPMLTRHRGHYIQVQTYKGVPTFSECGLRSLYVLKNFKILLSH